LDENLNLPGGVGFDDNFVEHTTTYDIRPQKDEIRIKPIEKDVSSAAFLLVSEASNYMTRHILLIDEGLTAN